MPDNSTIELAKSALSHKTPKKSTFKVVEETRVPTSDHAIEPKSFLSLSGISSNHEISLLKRYVDLTPSLYGFVSDISMSRADIYMTAWSLLKERGIPVVPTVRKVNDNTVAVTNLNANGYSVYDMKIDSDPERKKLETDELFSKIPHKEIEQRAKALLEIANKNGIEIPDDGMFHLIINNEGRWGIMLIDIAYVGIYKDPKGMDDGVKMENFDKVEEWLRKMGDIQVKISSGRL